MYVQKYAALPISQLLAETVLLHTKGLLFRIHTITGWSLPDDEYFLNTLVSEFKNLLMESYKDLNVEEIAYAVRNYGLTVKDWGKNINLSLIDQPIAEYRRVRRCLSEMEERKTNTKTVEYKPTPEQVMSMRREVIETYYQDFLKGNRNSALYPTDGVDTLVLDGYCEEDYHTDFLKPALRQLRGQMQNNIDQLLGKQLIGQALTVRDDMNVLTEQNLQVVFLAKKLALLSCFEFFMAAMRERIYFFEQV